MASNPSDQLFLPVFGGQGTSRHESSSYRMDPTSLSPLGITLLTVCHTVFLSDLASLEDDECISVGICASQMMKRESILHPLDGLLFDNPAFSGPHLLLTQALQYLFFVEKKAATSEPIPFLDILRSNAYHGVGILGFSSGIISACVVASSSSVLSFLQHAVEGYRLAFWIGVRSQIYRTSLVDTGINAPRPWTVVLLGINRENLLRSIEHFNQFNGKNHVVLTAVMDESHHTVSGNPEDLNLFLSTLPNSVASHVTTINALYHCSSFLRGVRDEVLRDVIAKQIRFPSFLDLLAPIRCTFSGELLSKTTSGSLVETVVDMVLMHRVNWDSVLHQIIPTLPRHVAVKLIDVGLGASLVRGFQVAACRRSALKSFEVVYPMEEAMPKFKTKQEPIAIIGMAVNMPGAPTASKLWELISNGQNTVEKIPPNRFTFEDYHSGRAIRAETGNFVHNVDLFDNKFFNISPREARSMDPQQRILLHAAYEALEDAGFVPYGSPMFDPAKIGCYIGSATHDYVLNLRNEIDVYYSTGTLNAFISGRLSYFLGLSGPSIVVDTACSSSIVAIHQACRALMNKDCHAALAGGVNVISSPDMFVGLDRGHFLNSSGQCKPFDAEADGYSRGEGCGIFVLKRLTDAVCENDRILGIIRGVEVNQSGKATSITHPHGPTQEDLFKQLLMNSDVDVNSVNVVEAHGTGTQAGDTAEMESIRRLLLTDDRAPDNPLYITSIKGNIGHLEAASGCASLAKVLLMLRHEMIPRQISLSGLNPQIAHMFADNCILPTRNVAWMPPKRKTPRMALVNNFGAAGSNAALLLQEYIVQKPSSPLTNVSSYVFGLSAKDKDSLESLRSKYLAWLRRPSTQDLSILDIAYTATARRQVFPYRLATSAGSVQQLVKKLEKESIVHVPRDEGGPEVVFVFSGQGHRSHEMAVSLYKTSTVFRRHIDECHSVLISNGFAPITSVITGAVDDQHQVPAVHEEEVNQTATFALQYALSKLWITWGVMPVAAVGHSLGEYAALVIAGVLRLEDAIIIVATRARLVLERCPLVATGMVAVSLGPTKLQRILDSSQSFANISIACYNSPTDCVVSGPLHELEDFKSFLKEECSGKFTQLNVPYGYHSPLMSHLTDDLMVISGKTLVFPPCIPFISTVLGRVITPGDRSFPSQDYFARQCVEPVKFTDAIGSYQFNNSGKRIWLEISTHPSVLPMLRSFPALSDSLLLGSLRACEDSWTSLSKSLTSLYHHGAETIRWRSVFGEIGAAKCISLPSYSFNKTKFWVPYVAAKVKEVNTTHSLVNQCVQFPGSGDDKVAIFQTPIGQLKHFIKGHRVGGVPLCPASVYLELISGAIGLTAGYTVQHVEDSETVLCQLIFPKPLAVNHADPGGASKITITIDHRKRSFVLKSRGSLLDPDAIHASGEYSLRPIPEVNRDFSDALASIHRRVEGILKPGRYPAPKTFLSPTIYRVIFPRVVEYSEMFHTLKTMSILVGGMEAAGTMALSTAEGNSLLSRTVFLDTLIHAAGFLCNLSARQNDAYLCIGVGSMQLISTAIKDESAFTVYCKLSSSNESDIMIGECYVLSHAQPTKLIAQCKDLRFQRVRLSSLKHSLENRPGIIPFRSIDEPRYPNLTQLDAVTAIIDILAKLCDIHPSNISVDMDLESLGLDFLMHTKLFRDLSTAFPGLHYRIQEFEARTTVSDLVNSVLLALASRPSVERLEEISHLLNDASNLKALVPSANCRPSMKQIISRVLELQEDSIKDDSELSSLGLDSLSSIEAAHYLRQEWKINVPGSLFSSCRTVLELESQILNFEQTFLPSVSARRLYINDTIDRQTSPSFQISRSSMSTIQIGLPARVPLVLVHDGTSLITPYTRLAKLSRTVCAIHNPTLAFSESWDTLEEMAESYSQMILEGLDGPIILGGWSFGGVVAFEIARQLRTKSIDVIGLILIDSPCPLSSVSLSASLLDDVLNNLEPKSREFCKSQLLKNSQLLCKYAPLPEGPNEPLIFLMSEKPYVTLHDVQISPWLSDRSRESFITDGWEALSGGPVETFSIPGNHFEAFDAQNVQALSDCISKACDGLEKNRYH